MFFFIASKNRISPNVLTTQFCLIHPITPFFMKKAILCSLLFLSASLAHAETTITLEGVHNCCQGCTNGIVKSASDLKDVTVTAEDETVTITAKSKAQAKKAIEALLAAGYYGKSSETSAEAAAPSSGLPKVEKPLNSATVSSVHLCCQKCVNAMTSAVKSVPGVASYDIANKSKTFTVQGDFKESDLITAMNKAGFHGTVGK